MKKQVRMFFIVMVSIVLVFSGCQSTKDAAGAISAVQLAAIHSKVASIDKYGNNTVTAVPADFLSAGYEIGDLLSVVVGDFTFDAPLVTNYSDVDNGKFLIREKTGDPGAISLAINMGNFMKKSQASIGSPVTFSLKEKAGYLKEFQIRQLKKSENRTDYESDEIFANFRPVKAGNIAKNILYRSCNPALGDARAPYAAALAEKAGVKTVINLADSEESLSKHIAEAPYYKQLYDNGSVIVLDMGVSFSDPDFVQKLHDGLVFMANHDGPYLVHCNEGKDRAGFVSALLEAVSGATIEEMTDDYMKSFENYYGVQKGTERYELIGKTISDMFTELNGGKQVTNKNIGKIADVYLQKTVGLDPKTIGLLKAKLQGK